MSVCVLFVLLCEERGVKKQCHSIGPGATQQHGPNAAADLLIPGGKSRKQAFVGTGLPPFPLGVGNQFIPFKYIYICTYLQ